jgi:hypothetical protein
MISGEGGPHPQRRSATHPPPPKLPGGGGVSAAPLPAHSPRCGRGRPLALTLGKTRLSQPSPRGGDVQVFHRPRTAEIVGFPALSSPADRDRRHPPPTTLDTRSSAHRSDAAGAMSAQLLNTSGSATSAYPRSAQRLTALALSLRRAPYPGSRRYGAGFADADLDRREMAAHAGRVGAARVFGGLRGWTEDRELSTGLWRKTRVIRAKSMYRIH